MRTKIYILKAKITIKILCFLFFTTIIYSQQFQAIKSVNASLGLPSDLVYCVTQDLEGHIWISTDNGITCFNGESFKHFQMEDGLPSNDIFNIRVDSKNRVWLTGYFEGLYYIQNNNIKLIKGSEKKSGIHFKFEKNGVIYTNSINTNECYYISKNEELVKIETNGSLKFVDFIPNENAFVAFKLDETKGSNRIQPQMIYPNNTINIPNDFNIYPGISINNKVLFISGFNKKITSWVDRNFNLNFLELKNTEIKLNEFEKLFNKKINQLNLLSSEYNKKASVFLLNEKEIIVFKNGKFDSKLSEFATKLPVDFKNIFSLFIDEKNNFWIIDKGFSLTNIPFNYDKISNYDLTNAFLRKSEIIKSTTKFKNFVYLISTDNNIYALDLLNNKTKFITKINNFNPYKIIVQNNKLLVACNEGFVVLEINNKKVNIENITKIYNRNCIYYNNKIYLLSNQSLIQFDKKITNLFDRKKELRYNNIINIDDVFLISNEKEVFSYNLKTNSIQSSINIKNTNFLSYFNGLFMVATNNCGIYFLDSKLKTKHHIPLKENCYTIKAYQNKIIVSTDRGIKIYQLRKNKFILINSYSYLDGLLNERIVDFHFNNSQIIVFSKSGISTIKLNYKNTSNIKAIEIDRVIINNEDQKKQIPSQLKRHQNNITFITSIFSFENSKNVRRFYKLIRNKEKGSWINYEERQLSFKNLNYGDYTLYLKAINLSNSKNIVYNKVKFNIEPKFWETKFFLIISIAFGLTVIIVVVFFLKNKVQNKLKLKYRIQNLELRALKAQMNPHFIFNALNTFQSIAFIEGEEKANDYLNKFSKLIRLTLDVIVKDEIEINDEIQYLKSYIEFEQLRTKKQCNYAIIVSDSLNDLSIKIPVMIIQPLIENIFKHAFNEKQIENIISIEMSLIDFKSIKIVVEDNGVGILNKKMPIKDEHFSHASNIIKERLQILESLHKRKCTYETIDLSSINKKGTRVTLILPIT